MDLSWQTFKMWLHDCHWDYIYLNYCLIHFIRMTFKNWLFFLHVWLICNIESLQHKKDLLILEMMMMVWVILPSHFSIKPFGEQLLFSLSNHFFIWGVDHILFLQLFNFVYNIDFWYYLTYFHCNISRFLFILLCVGI